MIDTDVRCGDWLQYSEEQIKHVLEIAGRQGLAAVIDDGTKTEPTVDSLGLAQVRLFEASRFYPNVFYGLLMKADNYSPNLYEMAKFVSSTKTQFRNARIVGLRGCWFSISNEFFRSLSNINYRGVVCVDFRDIDKNDIASFAHQAYLSGFSGRLHIPSIGDAKTIQEIAKLKEIHPNLSCGTTFPYLFLRGDSNDREGLLECLRNEQIDVLSSGHDPMQGYPGIAYWYRLLSRLEERGVSRELIDKLTHDNVNMIFGTDISRLERKSDPLAEGNDFDSYTKNHYLKLGI